MTDIGIYWPVRGHTAPGGAEAEPRPGAAGEVILFYRVNTREPEEDLAFELRLLSPEEDDELCWAVAPGCTEALARPEDIDQNTWIDISGSLDDVLGSGLEQVVESLAEISTRLAFRGRDPSSVSEALDLAIHTAWTREDPSHFSSALSGVLRDPQGNPLDGVRLAAVRGAERGCGLTSPSGFFVIEGLQGGGTGYQLEVEGFDVTAELEVPAGGEASFGNVIVGEENGSPFACEVLEDSLEIGNMGLPQNRLRQVERRRLEVISPVDPNYKTGTAGQSAGDLDLEDIETEQEKSFSENDQVESWVEGLDDEKLTYEITFQNHGTAGAPAQDVDVVDLLPEEIDPGTVEFLAVGVDYQISCFTAPELSDPFTNPLEKPPCAAAYGPDAIVFFFRHDETFDRYFEPDDNNPNTPAPSPPPPVYLQVTCRNEQGELRAEFRSTDASENLLSVLSKTESLLEGESIDELGFLYPHDTETDPVVGEAFVQFRAALKKDSRSPGTLVRNRATVHFLDNIVGGDGGGGGVEAGEVCPGPVCETNAVYYLVPRESDFVNGCNNTVTGDDGDDDGDGAVDCDDTDCAEDPVCAGPGGAAFVRGDTNSDGSINLTDGVIPLLFLFSGGGAPVCLDAADANDSGAIEITDAIIIFSWLFTGGDVPAEPSPTVPGYPAEDCGEDLTEDGIDCEQASPVCQ